MVETRFAPEVVNVAEGSRISLPRQYCEKIPWLTGDPMTVWLLELVRGRFRLLSDQEVEQDQKLFEIRRAIIDGPDGAKASPTEFESSAVASLVARLIPTTISPHRPSWRLVIPRRIAPNEKNELLLLFSSGYLEIWWPDIYDITSASRLDSVI